LFCQLSVSGRPAIEDVVCPKAGDEVSHRRIPEKMKYLAMRAMFFLLPKQGMAQSQHQSPKQVNDAAHRTG
jgi:hypothetical protein